MHHDKAARYTKATHLDKEALHALSPTRSTTARVPETARVARSTRLAAITRYTTITRYV